MTLTKQQQPMSDASFWKAVDSKLIRFGGSWSKVRIVRAKGTYLYDADGRRILDFTSGQMSSVLGHGNEEIAEVVSTYVRDLDHLFSAMVTEPVVSLADKLTSMMPEGLDKCMFLSTGGEANELALKIAKTYTGGFEIVSLSAGYHGMTHGAGSATFAVGRRGHGPPLPGQLVLPVPYAYRSPFRHPDGSHDWQAELAWGWSLVDAQSCGALAAVIVEPIVSTGGLIDLPEGYLAALKRGCEERGMLLIVDEAQTGLGRTGAMFAFERDGIVPDILTLSKTLGAGLPLAATITSKENEEKAHERGLFWITTHMNDPLPAAVGEKVCDIIQRDGLVAEAKRKGEILREGLLGLQKKYPQIGDVRGRGLMMGIEIVKDPETKEPADELGTKIAEKAMQLGLSCNIVQIRGLGGTFRIAPPLTVTDDEIKEGIDVLDKAFAACV